MLHARSGGRRPITGGNDHLTKLLVQADGANGTTTFTDNSVGGLFGRRHTVTRTGNTVMSNSVGLQGRAVSLAFDGSGDDLTIANHSDFDLADHNFTIDFWYYASSIPGVATSGRAVFGNSHDATKSGFHLFQDNVNGSGGAGAWGFFFGTGSAWNAVNVLSGGVAAGVAVHFAVVRDRTKFTLYKGGVQADQVTVAADFKIPASSADFKLGRCPTAPGSTNADFHGYLGEFRLSKGIARWTANFTPPASPWKSWE